MRISRGSGTVNLLAWIMQYARANRIGSGGLVLGGGLGGLMQNIIQRLLYLGGNVVKLMICRTRGGEGRDQMEAMNEEYVYW